MDNFDKPVYRRDEPPAYDKIMVNPVEKDKKPKEDLYKSAQDSTKSQVFSVLVACFRKLILALSPKEGQRYIIVEEQLLEDVIRFRQLLLVLAAKDESHNPEFTEQLTGAWHLLSEDCASLIATSETPSPLIEKIKFFIAQIENYPLGADHTLGFYFAQYAGKDWIPFPFMQLLQELHEEHQLNSLLSTLSSWIYLITEIMREAGHSIEP